MENIVDEGPVRSAIHVILPVRMRTGAPLSYLGGRALLPQQSRAPSLAESQLFLVIWTTWMVIIEYVILVSKTCI